MARRSFFLLSYQDSFIAKRLRSVCSARANCFSLFLPERLATSLTERRQITVSSAISFHPGMVPNAVEERYTASVRPS